jgi:hypothetical protein
MDTILNEFLIKNKEAPRLLLLEPNVGPIKIGILIEISNTIIVLKHVLSYDDKQKPFSNSFLLNSFDDQINFVIASLHSWCEPDHFEYLNYFSTLNNQLEFKNRRFSNESRKLSAADLQASYDFYKKLTKLND